MNKVELKVNSLNLNKEIEGFSDRGVGFLAQYLIGLGIKKEDVMCFINKPRDTDFDDPTCLDNIDEAASNLVRRLDFGAKVFVQVDSDTDGYTSSAILISYLRRRWSNVQIVWRLHSGKEHGIIPETVPNDCGVVIIPDAGSNQFDEQNILTASGKTVIVLDHHEVDKLEETKAFIVNNQLSNRFTNKSLSGAGVVLMFIKYLDEHFFATETSIYRDYLDLAAVGIIADAMNMTSLGNNYIAYYGLNNIKNKFLYELALKQSRGIEDPQHLTKIDVAFYIAPVINGVIRSGSTEDKEMVFKALTTENDTQDYKSEWRGVVRHENLYQYAVRLATNAKGRQDSATKKAFEWLCKKIDDEGWNQHNVIIATLDDKESSNVSPNITGLIAMKLVSHYNKPALVLRHTEYEDREVYGGSGRNGNFYGLPDFKSFLHDANAWYVEGHANAFGCFLLPDQADEIRKYADEHLNVHSFEEVYQVDYWFKGSQFIDYDMLMSFAKQRFLWGNSIPQPKFAFSGTYNKKDIFVMGKDKTSLKLHYGLIDFVEFSAQKHIDELLAQEEGTFTVIGRPQINNYNGNISIQIMIDDMEVNPKVIPAAASLLDLI